MTTPADVAFLWMILGWVAYLAAFVVALILVARSVNIVDQWERRPVLLFGRYIRTLGPGLSLINPIATTLDDVDVADAVSTVKMASVQTHDNVPMSFVFVLTTRILPDQVREWVVNVSEDAEEPIETRAMAAANEVIGSRTLDQILSDRASVTAQIREQLQAKVTRWGVEVEALEIQDFGIVDEHIQNSIAMKARAQKEAEGELKRAQMQHQIAVELNKAAETLHPAGWRLKSFEVLVELCRSAQNNTILLPTDLGSLAKLMTRDAE